MGLFIAAALPFGGLLSLLTPLPVALCYYRSRPPGLAVALAGTLLVSLPATSEARTVALFFLELAAAGVVMGEVLRRRLGPEATFGLGLAGLVLASLGIFLVHAATLQQDPAALAQSYGAEILAEARRNLTSLGYAPDEGTQTALQGLARLLPAVLILTAGALFAVNLTLARRLLKALNEPAAEWPSFRLWSAPEPLIWLPIGAGLLIMAGAGPSRVVGLNLLALAAVVYFVQGLAIAAFYLERLRVPRPLRLVGYALLAAQQYLSLAVAAVGLFDLWIDFRRLKQAAVEEAES